MMARYAADTIVIIWFLIQSVVFTVWVNSLVRAYLRGDSDLFQKDPVGYTARDCEEAGKGKRVSNKTIAGALTLLLLVVFVIVWLSMYQSLL